MVQTASLSQNKIDQLDHKTNAYKNLDLRAPSLAQIRKGVTIDSLRMLSLLCSDSFALMLAWQVMDVFSERALLLRAGDYSSLTPLFMLVIHLWFIAAHGLYGAREHWRQYGNLAKAIGLAQISLILLNYLVLEHGGLPGMMWVLVWVTSSAFVCACRWLVDWAIAYMRQAGRGCYSSLLICTPDTLGHAVQSLAHQNRYRLKGWIDANVVADSDSWSTALSHITPMGISEVFLWPCGSDYNSVFLYWTLRNAGVKLHILSMNSAMNSNAPFHRLNAFNARQSTQLTFAPPFITGSDFWLKRGVDFCAALVLLVLLSPFLLLIALLIKLDSPGPVFFKQTRMGLKNQEFKAWKFRTMVANAEQLQKQLEAQNETKDGVLFKIKADPRITRVGRFLRQYSLDELPQIINVLLGEMSLVGPRPLPLRDIEKFASHHFIRHEVLPGITGLWQVSGRSNIVDFEDVVRLDRHYIENWSLWLDLKILLQTVKVVLQKTGAY